MRSTFPRDLQAGSGPSCPQYWICFFLLQTEWLAVRRHLFHSSFIPSPGTSDNSTGVWIGQSQRVEVEKGKVGVRVSMGMNLSSISLWHVTLSKMFPPLSLSFLIYEVRGDDED